VGVVLAISLVAASCGGDDGAADGERYDGAADGERFCELDAQFQTMDGARLWLDHRVVQSAPKDLADGAAAARTVLAEWKASAPDEIGPSVEIWANAYLGLVDVWEAGDFVRAQMDDGELRVAFGRFNGGETDAASDVVIGWVDANCSS
jgi:hypothetical protein